MMPCRRNTMRRTQDYLRARAARITRVLVRVLVVRMLVLRFDLRRWADGDVEVFRRGDVPVSINQLNANRPLAWMSKRQARKSNRVRVDKLPLAGVGVIHRWHKGRHLERDALGVEITLERNRRAVAAVHPGAGRHQIQLTLVERILKGRRHFRGRSCLGRACATHATLT